MISINHLEIFTNCYGRFGIAAAIEHASTLGVRLNWDTANVYYHNEGMQDGEAELARVAEYVAHLHLKDSRRGYHDWFFPALGEAGGVDFANVGRILKDAGFQGHFSIELEGVRGEPEQTLEERQARLERSVRHLRDVGMIA